ncbi:MAG: hypothetical protein V3W34_00570 [Phycisphaerae bacterium]
MRQLARFSVFFSALVGLLLMPTSAIGQNDRESAEGAAAPPFQIATHSDDEITGAYTRDALRISFTSRLVTPTRVVLQVQLDGAVLDAEVDLAHETAILDGHGHALSVEQIKAIQAVGNDLERYLDPDRRKPLRHEDMLYRVLSFYTMVPPGIPLERLEVSAAVSTCFPADTSGAGGICGGGAEDLLDCNGIDSCLDDNNDGICYLETACDCAYYDVWHDSLGHCFCREIQGAGADLDSGCIGRGGAGCDGGLIFGLDCDLAGSNGEGIYTIDFVEHDRCCGLHDSEGICDNIACFDEAVDALDDCLFGERNCDGDVVACCFSDSSCNEQTSDQCVAVGGVPGSFSSTCATQVCPITEACCVAGAGCFDIEAFKCLGGGGVPSGPNTVCDATSCEQFGACCFASAATCVDGAAETDCVGAGADYLGNGSTCDAADCSPPVGACCLGTAGDCVSDAAEADCVAAGGVYQGDASTCATTTCPRAPVGACCFLDAGVCVPDAVEADCVAAGGVYQGDASACGATTCPAAAVGACCFASAGTCVDLAAEPDCLAAGASYLGDGSTCATADCSPPVGACCLGAAGDCVPDAAEAECVAAGGVYQGDASTCATTKCPVAPVGACCFVDAGACAPDAAEADCVANGGVYQGDASTCDTADCSPPVGACCFVDAGACAPDAAEADCVTNGGVYQGDGTMCETACP